MQLTGKARITVIVCAVLTVIGVVAWIFQLVNGLGVTGMNNSNSWGLYITNFMFFVGLSAGGLIVASSASVFHINQYKKVALPAVICSTVCICLAGMFVLIDLGGIQRVWRILTGPNFMSPLLWDICVITCYLIINILDMVWLVKGDERKVEVLSRIALPVAILVHSVTAWIFGLQVAKVGWYSTIMAPIFVASALDSGLALLIVSLIVLDKAGLATFDQKLMGSLGGLLAVFIAIDAFFIGCELLTMAYPGAAGDTAVLSQMFTGRTAGAFWFEIIGGLLVPFCIMVFAKNRQKKGLVTLACILVVCGVFCKRVWLLFTAFITPNVYGGSGITLGNQQVIASNGSMWTTLGTYAPTGLEFLIVVGVIALGVLVWTVLANKLLPNWKAEVAEA